MHYSVATREHFDAAKRPRLQVRYSLPTPTPTASATPTRTPTPSMTPTRNPSITPTTTPASTGRQIDAVYGQAMVDGVLDEWNGPATLVDASTANKVSSPEAVTGAADSSAVVRARWDQNYVYFAFDVRDEALFVDSVPDLWRDDSIELGVDGENDKLPTSTTGGDHQYQIRIDGIGADRLLTINPAVKYAAKYATDGYHVELAIPVAQLGGGLLVAGRTIGIDLGINDDDNGGDRDSLLVWASNSTYNDAPHFGKLILQLPATPTPTSTRQPAATATPTAIPTLAASSTPTPTAVPTATPLDVNSLTLTPAADTYINAWLPNSSYGSGGTLLIRPQVMAGLVRFDLSSIPANSLITDAELSMYALSRTNPQPLSASLYQLQRSWGENDATYYQATADQPWSAPLAASAGDRNPAPIATLDLPSAGWFTVDVTAQARTWLSQPGQNFGLLFEVTSTGNVQQSLASKEWSQGSLRPRLVVSYILGTPTPTPTPLPTATPTPLPTPTPKPTFTPTATPIPSPTPTATHTPTPMPTATPSHTPTITPTATASPTATFTPTPTPTTTPTPTGWRVITGGVDTYIRASFPSMNWGPSPTLLLSSPTLAHVLMDFDISGLPPGATVQQAALRIHVLDSALPGPATLGVYPLLRPWNANQATWQQASAGAPWAQAGAAGPEDRAAAPVASSSPLTSGGYVTLDITALVQQWLVDPASKHGMLLSIDDAGNKTLTMASLEWSLLDWRPRLEITLAPTP